MSDALVPGRVPPSDLDGEGIVLSTILLDPEALPTVQEILQAEHFYADANRRIFLAAVELQSTGRPVDAVSVAGQLRDTKRLDQVGGAAYLGLLTDATPYAINVAAHARRVRDKYRLRKLIAMCQTVEAEAYSGVADVQEFIGAAEAQIYAISQDALKLETGRTMQQVLAGCVDELTRKRSGEIPHGKLTPYRGLNRQLGCLKRGTVTTVASRPGMGKTSFVTELLVQSACDGSDALGSVFFSLEMPADQIGNKVVSQKTFIDTRALDTGLITFTDFLKAIDGANVLRKLPIIVNDKASITLTELRGALRRHQKALKPVKLGMVAIDYLQLMGTHDLPRGLNTNEQLEHIMRGLVALAKEFDVPVVLLSQLNRGLEARADKRPNLGDLRSSGAIEQDSYNIIFLYREDQYRKAHEPKDNLGELIVAKARGGRPGIVKVGFQPEAAKYIDSKEPADELDEWAQQFEERYP